jgi:hypothetical protein
MDITAPSKMVRGQWAGTDELCMRTHAQRCYRPTNVQPTYSRLATSTRPLPPAAKTAPPRMQHDLLLLWLLLPLLLLSLCQVFLSTALVTLS